MSKHKTDDIAATLAALQAQIAELTKRVDHYEHPLTQAAPQPAVVAAPQHEGLTEQELIAISAAIGAFLGVRAHIRQIRLVSSTAWAQQGRVSIQASHRLQG